MEFKFRAVDSRPSNPTSSSSSFNRMAGQALRFNDGFNRSLPQSVQRELEKQQIREEIMASEIARRRILEAEVRMELIAEREMATRVWDRGLYLEQRATMRLDARRPFTDHFDNYRRWQYESLPPSSLRPMFPPPMLPFRVTEVLDTEVNANTEGNKNKLIILDKPEPNRVVGAKWKAPPHAGASELPMPLNNLKKPNEEWSCAVCQVSATSEKGLMEHLQGKKHKTKEARLRDERMENNSTTILLNKKPPSKHAKVAEKTMDHSDQKLDDGEKMENRKDNLLIKRKDNLLIKRKKRAKKPRKRHNTFKNLQPTAADEVERTPKSTLKKKNMFWCEICAVRLQSEVVMETHKKGKKHIARLRKLVKKDKANVLALPDGPQMPKYTNVMSNESNKKLIDVPIIFINDIVNEKSSLDGIQMAKEIDEMANEANEKLICVPATSNTNTINEQALLDGVQMAKDTSLANEANAELVIVMEADHSN